VQKSSKQLCVPYFTVKIVYRRITFFAPKLDLTYRATFRENFNGFMPIVTVSIFKSVITLGTLRLKIGLYAAGLGTTAPTCIWTHMLAFFMACNLTFYTIERGRKQRNRALTTLKSFSP